MIAHFQTYAWRVLQGALVFPALTIALGGLLTGVLFLVGGQPNFLPFVGYALIIGLIMVPAIVGGLKSSTAEYVFLAAILAAPFAVGLYLVTQAVDGWSKHWAVAAVSFIASLWLGYFIRIITRVCGPKERSS